MGEATRDLIWVVGLFVAVGLLWLFTGGPNRPTEKDKLLLDSPLQNIEQGNTGRTSPATQYPTQATYYQAPSPTTYSGQEQGGVIKKNGSPWSGQVRLSTGNAQYEIQPMNEYVTLYSQSQLPINISGWRLVSNRQKVAYQPVSVAIPLGNKLFDPRLGKNLAPIILERGDQANIITGRMPSLTPYNIDTSFKVNVCSGYIGQLPNYQFTPSLYSNCPQPIQAPGIESLDEDCYHFVQRLPSCHTPEFRSVRNFQGEMEPGYVDNTPNLSSNCKDYLKSIFNYPACLDRNKNRSDFYGQTWYIYLGQKYELWGKERETISLYDSQNLLVDQISY